MARKLRLQYPGAIYHLTGRGNRQEPCGSNLTLSWPLPSAGFVLQQSVDLTSTNWANVTNSVTPTNYWNQVTVALPAGGNAFYRLAGP
jgi:hypothetical protein